MKWIMIDDMTSENGPLMVFPGSHRGPLYDLYGADGAWAGAMNDDDIAGIDLDEMVWLKGPAGSVTVHNCAMVHGSVPNTHAPARACETTSCGSIASGSLSSISQIAR